MTTLYSAANSKVYSATKTETGKWVFRNENGIIVATLQQIAYSYHRLYLPGDDVGNLVTVSVNEMPTDQQLVDLALTRADRIESFDQ